ncbi:DNA-binding transcriptional regulator BolA [Candidatus Kinetoplastibacterium sorsogonicusi]|uniref:DNA-binding transcriptional regulator BolA n=1 Tax=Candidatus Kinetoplastidibacterium kentomonadis TaxID=1576550 RepID=A0A3Q8EYA4_9PROT|nr:BolA family protein [Candidatus Kinetoplastibacterium sorsogonicusi]AWD32573.1 DNA-binding transcriptional regulator BolA [Candidatus Kinetoplastibacterium sorsogonicusi]
MKDINNTIQQIKKRLEQLSPSYLEIIDESSKHKNHLNNSNIAGHFCIKITSKLFDDKNIIDQHKIVYNALIDLFPKYIHALSIKII